jgi:hypothetical protein
VCRQEKISTNLKVFESSKSAQSLNLHILQPLIRGSLKTGQTFRYLKDCFAKDDVQARISKKDEWQTKDRAPKLAVVFSFNKKCVHISLALYRAHEHCYKLRFDIATSCTPTSWTVGCRGELHDTAATVKNMMKEARYVLLFSSKSGHSPRLGTS